jgi:hypothetical protein
VISNTYVYFIQFGDRGPVKIGVARDLKRRLDNLQIANHRKLWLRVSIGPMSPKEAQSVELQLHDFFARHRMRGEWFNRRVLGRLKRQYWTYMGDGIQGKVTIHDTRGEG